MRTLFISLAVITLSACNSQEPAPPAPSAAPTQEADPTPTLPPPTKDTFAAAYAAACPKAKPVSTAVCQSEGFGKQGFSCGYGLGDDPYQRFTANLEPGDGKWVLAEPDKACAAGDAAQ